MAGLNVAHLSKTFPGLKALDDVSLDVASGEIVSVVGQNGSGKSTLVKVLAGLYEPDPGAEIRRSELRFIHQDLGLVPSLSTVENLFVVDRSGWRGLLPLNRADEARAARRAVQRFGGHFDVTVPLTRLSAAERAIVAIARAMAGWQPSDGVLVLDEPTAALGAEEVDRLFHAIRRVAAEGAGVVFISHRLDEVLGLAHRIVALRDGRVVADESAADVDHEWLVTTIAGRQLAGVKPLEPRPDAAAALTVHGVSTSLLSDVDLTVRHGEVVGVCGLLGSGREHLAAAAFGAIERTGVVRVGERVVPAARPGAAIRAGLAYVPADRLAAGAVMEMSARENLTLPGLRSLRRAFGRLDLGAERAETADWVGRVGLSPPAPERPLSQFSGGNQQKMVLAKWLRNRPAVLLLDEPTQGVDIGAKAAVYELLQQAAAGGAAVLVSSTDLNELVAVSDRVLVLRDGRIVADIPRHLLSEEKLVRKTLRPSSDAALFEEAI